MADFLTQSSAYMGTFEFQSVTVDPVYKVCGVGNLNAANQFILTFWATKNGEPIINDLSSASFKLRDQSGAVVSGYTQTGLVPDVNGYYRIAPVSGALIFDLAHYVIELEMAAGVVGIEGRLGLVTRD